MINTTPLLPLPLPMPRYLIASEWCPALLDDESSTVRWTLDLVTEVLVDAQTTPLDGSSPWAPLSLLERSDLLEIIRRNEVGTNPASYGVHVSETLPEWSEAGNAPAPTPQPTGDLVKFLIRRQRSGRGPAA